MGCSSHPTRYLILGMKSVHLGDEFPLIVKLLHEGSSMGLSRTSIVEDETALRNQVDFIINTYHQPVLVQKFVLGREFTVGVLGNQDPYTLPITEVKFQRSLRDCDLLPG